MTIRELQYAIQDAIDDDATGVTDDCVFETKVDANGKREFFAVVLGRDGNGLDPALDKWVKIG